MVGLVEFASGSKVNNIVSNIKNLFALTAVLFLFTTCGSVSSSGTKTNRGSSAASNRTAVITSISAASISGSTPILESTSTSETTSTPKPTSASSPTPVDLESDSIYHYKIISEDADGNRVVSEDRIFKTKSDGTVSVEPVSEEEPSTTTPAPANEGATTAPDGATVITGLKTGDSLSVANHNSNILNNALNSGNKNLIILSGTWRTSSQVMVHSNTVLTFAEGAKLHQHEDTPYKQYSVLRINYGNVTVNNPHLSQKGIVHPHGTHACLMIYGSKNTGNVTINGGILEWGASNCFQGGRDITALTKQSNQDATA